MSIERAPTKGDLTRVAVKVMAFSRRWSRGWFHLQDPGAFTKVIPGTVTRLHRIRRALRLEFFEQVGLTSGGLYAVMLPVDFFTACRAFELSPTEGRTDYLGAIRVIEIYVDLGYNARIRTFCRAGTFETEIRQLCRTNETAIKT